MIDQQTDDKPRYFTLTQGAWVPTSKWNIVEQWDGSSTMLLAKGVRFVLRDGEYWIYSPLGFPLSKAQAATVEPLLEEAEPRIGQWLDSSPGTLESIFAALGELGIVTEADVRRAADYVADQDPHDLDAIERRNWIIYYPEG